MDERRKHDRFEETLEIKVTWPGKGNVIANTRDFSDGGTFVQAVFDPQPPADTEMLLQLTSQVLGREAPVIRARVVRTTGDGIAFEFIRD
jgi:hypothetical protein